MKKVLGITAIGLSLLVAVTSMAFVLSGCQGTSEKGTEKTKPTSTTTAATTAGGVSENETGKASDNSDVSGSTTASQTETTGVARTQPSSQSIVTARNVVTTKSIHAATTQTKAVAQKTDTTKTTKATADQNGGYNTGDWDGTLVVCPKDLIDLATGEVLMEAGCLTNQSTLDWYEDYVSRWYSRAAEQTTKPEIVETTTTVKDTYGYVEGVGFIIDGLIFDSEDDYIQWVNQGYTGYIELGGRMVPEPKE